ncbi:MAG: DNA/RNA non-specific endonuclease [Prevotella sp.]|nr:DNA/RNA non-specific endonuclease [Prevotella sp.]
MKIFRLLTILLTAALTFQACSSDDEDTPSANTNANKNDVTRHPDAGRMEFPRLKENNSVLIVHRSQGEVNYCVEWDYNMKSQRWSCYTLLAKNLSGKDPITGRNVTRYYGFPQYPLDPDLPLNYYLDRPSEDYTINDYFSGSGFDHGHICPSADRLNSNEANYQTFFLTNMQPQIKRFNGSENGYDGTSLWLAMENKVRSWTPRNSTDTLYVCRGGTIGNVTLNGQTTSGIMTLINSKLVVPKYFFSAVLLKNSLGYRALAFWFEHSNQYVPSNASLADYAISIDELEERTGIDFFCNLPDDVEAKVENNLAVNAWGLK